MSDEKIIVQVDPDLEELIPGFLENRKLDIEKLRSALNEKDFVNLGSIGHSIKGVGGGYGFDLMSEFGANIEIAAKENNADVIQENIDRLYHYLKCVEVEYT
ncbi:MAG TPA: Hpt domain-containing protein [Thiotrichaceae bacterium]|jgi:HPt (histidine-containing phosphotransfer) domain-containing protein|nr:Hpt domain-containing protein [Thiotrichaceae bacterium]HIM08770.1 Hpt domain-containing protein [Gammaproteobacteria bacterium]